MIKLLGICFIVLSSGLIGLSRSSGLVNRVKELTVLREMLVTIKLRLEFECPATDELISYLQENKRYYEYVKDIRPEKPDESLEGSSAYKALSLTGEEKQILMDTFSQLGRTDLATQLEMLSFNILRTEAALNEARADKKQKTKLYNSLGFMSGILLALLII